MTILIIEVLFLNKLWEKFLKTGKVEDYLTYRNKVGTKEDERVNGTVSSCNRDGAFHHAHIGLRQKNNDFDQRTR